MSFSVDMRGVDDVVAGTDDPLRDQIIAAYKHEPLQGCADRETFFQFSYQALSPQKLESVVGELSEGDSIGLLVEEFPDSDPDDPFGDQFFSLRKLARSLRARYPEIAGRTLDKVYREYGEGKIDDERVLAAVLLDLDRNPLPGYPVVVFRW
ncbi:hypothetical protein [Stratiformator vulcanicus]|uniref:Uncharacterized protein n=1 Tax=Stratiformator vulcanicus TaxID=2527980 RepID=A0A517QY94_9PLAN|nr:hypothetical protein [Stratiformator vulcanicus]QDT36530.1 hypothetical protein Pan189_08890 [Stratiformator vulcanicus]